MLRGITDEHLPALCEIAAAGIHPPRQMPFATPWTEAPPHELKNNLAQYQWSVRANFTKTKWELPLGVWHEGELAGVQSLHAKDFPVLRVLSTGSWLGMPFQGKGIGTQMRRAVCAFAFDHLGAAHIISAAYLDNPASLAVSRKVGYQDNGTEQRLRRGQPITTQRFLLTPSNLIRGTQPLIVDGAARLRAAIGLTSEPS
jgi:RimJ/RimL family protein N-acetyltransferase